mmetsp:Transcript_21803/g.51907  ORF Transcript_21803/g.51907 Transcript_21803/m.51907 type:complete len:233 (-) Transcript_21803:102-800(-)
MLLSEVACTWSNADGDRWLLVGPRFHFCAVERVEFGQMPCEVFGRHTQRPVSLPETSLNVHGFVASLSHVCVDRRLRSGGTSVVTKEAWSCVASARLAFLLATDSATSSALGHGSVPVMDVGNRCTVSLNRSPADRVACSRMAKSLLKIFDSGMFSIWAASTARLTARRRNSSSSSSRRTSGKLSSALHNPNRLATCAIAVTDASSSRRSVAVGSRCTSCGAILWNSHDSTL